MCDIDVNTVFFICCFLVFILERNDIESSESEVALLERLQEILMELQPYM